jgi:SPP1 gp7 family putative phage head morphogenesis protein
LRRALLKVQRDLLARFRSLPYRVTDAETGRVLQVAPQGAAGIKIDINQERIYEYQLDPAQIANTAAFIQELLTQFVLENRQPDWFMQQQVELAYELGTAEEVANLRTIAPTEYARTVQGVLASPAYQRRIQFTFARVFEEMQGFVEETRRDLARTLADGIAAGDNPITVSRRIRDRIGVANSRAQRIARTEINMAHRRARWDEDQDAQQNLGIMTMLMHLSALSPTTRKTHARRHGRLFTVQENRQWYNEDANAINCKCSQVSVLVDEEGEPRSPKFVAKVEKQGEDFFDE